MGKGDKKSKRGKIIIGSYGVRRQKRKKSHAHINNVAMPESEVSTVKETTEVAPRKKPSAKKTVKDTNGEMKPAAKKKSAGKSTETKKAQTEEESKDSGTPEASDN